jgi:hypothetical protein
MESELPVTEEHRALQPDGVLDLGSRPSAKKTEKPELTLDGETIAGKTGPNGPLVVACSSLRTHRAHYTDAEARTR